MFLGRLMCSVLWIVCVGVWVNIIPGGGLVTLCSIGGLFKGISCFLGVVARTGRMGEMLVGSHSAPSTITRVENS